MTIAAKGVDVENVKRQLDENNKEREVLLSKCKVKDLDELRTKREEYTEAYHNLSVAQKDYDNLIEGIDLDKLDEDMNIIRKSLQNWRDLIRRLRNFAVLNQ